MTSVNVTLQQSNVEVTSQRKTTTVEVPKTSVVQAVTAGPAGLAQVNGTAKVNGSVVYYDVLLTDPNGLKEYYLEGIIYVSQGYTR